MTKFTYRFLIYGVIMLYMLLDLQVFKGPMHSWLMTKRGKDPASLRAEGVAATVYGQAILETQVEHRMQTYLYQRGRTLEDVSAKEHTMLFKRCLEALITEHLLRIKTHYNQGQLSDTPYLKTSIEHDLLQFSDRYEREDALRRQGYKDGELELRAEAHLQQQQYLHLKIEHKPTPDELELLSGESIIIPERIKMRHLFLSSWEKSQEDVKASLEEALKRLKTGEVTFEELSKEINEDSRAKKRGGTLDWITAERLPEGLSESLFSLNVGDTQLMQSPLGWHYVEILDKKPLQEQPRSQQSASAYLENQKRPEGLKLYIKQLREREKGKVTIYWQQP